MTALAPLGGLAAALALLAATAGLDQVAREGQLGPAFWPRLVLAGLAVVCAVRLAGAWRHRAGSASHGAVSAGDPPLARGVLAAAIGLILLYVVATPIVGFPLATGAFIAGFTWLGGARSAPGLAATAAVGTVALLYLFIRIVYLPLPKGAGPFETLTLALYRALGIF